MASNNGESWWRTRVLTNSRYCDQDCRNTDPQSVKVLAGNLCWPSGRLRLYVGLIGLAQSTVKGMSSYALDLVVCEKPSSSCSWVWVGECFFWYRLTWVVPDKEPLNVCVCVCICMQCKSTRHYLKTLEQKTFLAQLEKSNRLKITICKYK